MKRILRVIWLAVKWTVVVALCVEVLSFVIISVGNLVLYGEIREGGRALYDGYAVFLQSEGIRKTEFNSRSDDPKKNVTIWALGGSTMRGSTSGDDKTIASQLAKALNASGDGRHFTVTNYGMLSFNSLLEAKYLQKLLIESPEKPNLIIFYDGTNDAKYFAEHGTPYGHHGYRRVRAIIESYRRNWFGVLKPLNAAIYCSFTKELYDKVHQILIPLQPDSAGLNQLARLTQERYDHVNKLAGCYGADFLLFWQPTLWIDRCTVPESVQAQEKGVIVNSDRFVTVRRNLTLPYLAIKERLKGKPYFIDFQDALCDRTVAAYEPDGVHTTDAGNEMVAQKMAKAVLERLAK